jgi:hypothetical protein
LHLSFSWRNSQPQRTSSPKNRLGKSTVFLIVPVLLLLGYVGAYFGVLALPGSVRLPSCLAAQSRVCQYIEANNEWNSYPDYHGLPEWFFAPIHEYDRRYLRPSLWSGSYPKNQERSFNSLLGP